MYFLNEAEKQAVQTVVKLGSRYGYGNLIDRLKMAWAKSLLQNYGDKMSIESAFLAAGSERDYTVKDKEQIINWIKEYIGEE